jgi:hypothetical protein
MDGTGDHHVKQNKPKKFFTFPNHCVLEDTSLLQITPGVSVSL